MKFTKYLLSTILLISILSCAKEPPEKLLINLTKKTSKEFSEAKTGKQAGDIIITFAKESEQILKQYPNLKETISTSEFSKEFGEVNSEFVKSVNEIGNQFGQNPDFQKALKEFSSITR